MYILSVLFLHGYVHANMHIFVYVYMLYIQCSVCVCVDACVFVYVCTCLYVCTDNTYLCEYVHCIHLNACLLPTIVSSTHTISSIF